MVSFARGRRPGVKEFRYNKTKRDSQMSNTTLPTLHGANISPYVRKVRVALAHKSIKYNSVQQSPFGAPEEFKSISPLSKIPCWEEGDLTLPDSSVILGYLEHRYTLSHRFCRSKQARGPVRFGSKNTLTLNSVKP